MSARKRARVRDAPRESAEHPKDAARIARRLFHPEQETFVAMYIDSRKGLIDAIIVAIGTVNSVDVYPRDVFREAIRHNAVAIVVAHNHPTGDPTPSSEDIALTRRLREVGELVGIPLVDHLVVTDARFVSIASDYIKELEP